MLLENQNVLEANQGRQALTKLSLSLAFYESAIPPNLNKYQRINLPIAQTIDTPNTSLSV
jgi:hypothetical protein